VGAITIFLFFAPSFTQNTEYRGGPGATRSADDTSDEATWRPSYLTLYDGDQILLESGLFDTQEQCLETLAAFREEAGPPVIQGAQPPRCERVPAVSWCLTSRGGQPVTVTRRCYRTARSCEDLLDLYVFSAELEPVGVRNNRL
jgi:hypothetical protein